LKLVGSRLGIDLLELGWNKKVAYCIAFSVDGATDVTRRYVRLPDKHGAARTRAPEEALLWTIHEIRGRRRENLSKDERDKLQKEDDREEMELRNFLVSALIGELGRLGVDGKPRTRSDDQKTPVAQQEGAAELLRRERGGTGHSGPDRSGGGR
jgi:peptide-N4-(N-acetyl-beta-glucosaminyl)asparagine amidase